MHKAVFLDRDGIINQKAAPHHYISRPEDFVILPGVPKAIKLLNDAGYLVIVVTNQRGVARGLVTKEQVKCVHTYLQNELRKKGAHIDAFYVCPHEKGECCCRKPNIGLFLMAEHDLSINKSCSWMVGDSETDVEAGRRYGVRSILTKNLLEAAKIILREIIQ